jgi:hypothetical protein
MPGYDRTGPMGMGPRTGGGFGYCGSNAGFGNQAGYSRRGGVGRALGQGWGGRCGFGRRGAIPWGYAPPSSEQESAYLKNQAVALEQELAAVKERLDRIESEKQK